MAKGTESTHDIIPPSPNNPNPVYDTLIGFVRVRRVEIVVPDENGDLVEVRAEAGTGRRDSRSDPLVSLRWHCRQDAAPKAGEVLYLRLTPSTPKVAEPKSGSVLLGGDAKLYGPDGPVDTSQK